MADLFSNDDIAGAIRVVAHRLTPVESASWAADLSAPLHRAGIITARRLGAFLGQVAFESVGFTVMAEDLNYSAFRMMQVWPSHFGAADPNAYAHNPEALGNFIYANRLGNGDEASGDGYRFRGAGLIDLTGRGQFALFGESVGLTAEAAADWARPPAGAAASACWFWNLKGLNALADGWELTALTQKINGGLNGLADRKSLCNSALSYLADLHPAPAAA